MELFTKIVNGLKPLTNFAKNSILDVWQGSEYAFAFIGISKVLQSNVKTVDEWLIPFSS